MIRVSTWDTAERTALRASARRFTGTEIHADVGECAVEVLNAAEAARKRIFGQ